MQLRYIDEAAAQAAANMARDEALLLGDSPAALRLYNWAPHAVSLGYFQRLQDFDDVPPGTSIVRRLTGGGAIHHGEEVTFALALDADLLPASVDASYGLLHDAIVRAVASIGVLCTRLEHGPPPGARPKDRWCFAVPGRHDIVDRNGRKLCGSAQRRLRTSRGPRVLHHGSLVIERPSLTPFVAAIVDMAPIPSLPELRRRLAAELAAALSMNLEPSTIRSTEAEVAETLRRTRYEDQAFTATR